MLTLHDKSVVVDHVPMEHDLLVSGKFEQHVNNFIVFINTKY